MNADYWQVNFGGLTSIFMKSAKLRLNQRSSASNFQLKTQVNLNYRRPPDFPSADWALIRSLYFELLQFVWFCGILKSLIDGLVANGILNYYSLFGFAALPPDVRKGCAFPQNRTPKVEAMPHFLPRNLEAEPQNSWNTRGKTQPFRTSTDIARRNPLSRKVGYYLWKSFSLKRPVKRILFGFDPKIATLISKDVFIFRQPCRLIIVSDITFERNYVFTFIKFVA